MQRAIVVKGKLADSRHIELDDPVTGIEGEVEVALRPLPKTVRAPGQSLLDFLAKIPTGTRSKDDIDRQIQADRDSWNG